MSGPEQDPPEPPVGESELDVLITIRDILAGIAEALTQPPTAS